MGDDLPFVDLGGDYNATHLSDSPGTNSNYCAVLHPDGEIKCWGYAQSGALGQGTTTNTQMGDALPAVRMAHGPKLSVAVADAGPWTCTLDAGPCESDLQASYSTENLCTSSKIHQRIRF